MGLLTDNALSEQDVTDMCLRRMEGATLRTIARQFKIDTGLAKTLTQYVPEEETECLEKQKRLDAQDELRTKRLERVRRLKREGYTLRGIAADVGITAERVRQLLEG